MRHIDRCGAFKRQYKLMQKRGKDDGKIHSIVSMLANDATLPASCRDHALTGNFSGFRDCHIEPDWLLIYAKANSEDGQGILYLEATGTHADLF